MAEPGGGLWDAALRHTLALVRLLLAEAAAETGT